MSYFRLRQDTDYIYAPVIPDVITKINRRHITPEQADKIAKMTIFQLAAKEKHDFLDLLDRQLFLVSDLLQEVIQYYVPQLTFKIVVLAAHKEQHTYHLPIFSPVDCLSEKSILTPDKSKVRHLVLNQSAIEHLPIFRVQHSHETIVIARLDAAESILRRTSRGVKLHPVELA